MSVNKASFQSIVDALCLRADITQQVSEQFVMTFFDIIRESLRVDKIVKVRGLGTFKMVDVEARESVKVGTGERYVIDSHSKITFTPDPILRDAINRPFADFETVVLNDGVDLAKMEDVEDEQREDTETTEELGNEQCTETEAEAEVVPIVEMDEPTTPFETAELEMPVAEPPVAVDEDESQQSPTPVFPIGEGGSPDDNLQHDKLTIYSNTESKGENYNDKENDNEQQKNTETTEKSGNRVSHPSDKSRCNIVWNIVGAVLMLAIGYVLGNLMPFKNQDLTTSKKEQTLIEPQPTLQESPTIVADTDTVKKDSTVATPIVKPVDAPSTEVSEPMIFPQLTEGEYEIVGVEDTVIMRPGKTLLNMSIKYYGTTKFVDYICVMNGITNPDVVPLDKEILIPKLRRKK